VDSKQDRSAEEQGGHRPFCRPRRSLREEAGKDVAAKGEAPERHEAGTEVESIPASSVSNVYAQSAL
jgi:hypothetical protein